MKKIMVLGAQQWRCEELLHVSWRNSCLKEAAVSEEVWVSKELNFILAKGGNSENEKSYISVRRHLSIEVHMRILYRLKKNAVDSVQKSTSLDHFETNNRASTLFKRDVLRKEILWLLYNWNYMLSVSAHWSIISTFNLPCKTVFL